MTGKPIAAFRNCAHCISSVHFEASGLCVRTLLLENQTEPPVRSLAGLELGGLKKKGLDGLSKP